MQKISTICSSYKSGNKIDIIIKSFNNQDYDYKELIIVEGSETDSNFKLLCKKNINNKNIKIFYLPNSTIYECLNYGIKKSSGEIINIMGDDDKYINEKVFKNISDKLSETLDYIYGNTIFEYEGKNVRYYKSYNLNNKLMNIGYMPSHTSLFLKKEIYDKLGDYNVKYKIASDLEFFFRLVKYSQRYLYINRALTVMSDGGTSNKSIRNILISNIESLKILKKNNYNLTPLRLLLKLIFKVYLIAKFKYSKKIYE